MVWPLASPPFLASSTSGTHSTAGCCRCTSKVVVVHLFRSLRGPLGSDFHTSCAFSVHTSLFDMFVTSRFQLFFASFDLALCPGSPHSFLRVAFSVHTPLREVVDAEQHKQQHTTNTHMMNNTTPLVVVHMFRDLFGPFGVGLL